MPVHDMLSGHYIHYWTNVRVLVFKADEDWVQLLDVDGNHIMTITGIDRVGPSLNVGDYLKIRDFYFDSKHDFMSMRFASDVEVLYKPREYSETRLLVYKHVYRGGG